MSTSFPRTDVGGLSLSRMIIGTNWVLGYSHTSPAADTMIKSRHAERDSIVPILETFLDAGVDTMMGLFADSPALREARKIAEDRTGKGLIVIDTPPLNVDDSPEARREAEATIATSRANGATFCFPHHSSTEQLVNKNSRSIPRLTDYLAMIRDHGMIPGLSAHMPELVIYSDANDYDVETYIQIYNCAGFLMQVEIEYIHRVIWNAKKPVMTIKSMAAGRISPFVGITFSYASIRPCDLVTVGCFTPEEAREDTEIGRAAIDRRAPVLAGRASPNKTAIMA